MRLIEDKKIVKYKFEDKKVFFFDFHAACGIFRKMTYDTEVTYR